MAKIILTLFILCTFIGLHAETAEQKDSLFRELQEVVVTAKQPATKLVGTTLVTTIPGSGLQNLGTVLDVLNQLPMIKVEDNSVSVVGKGVPEIYIDGRPMRNEEELNQLRSSDIKKIELLMSPGAMYSSTTTSVLKITTRKNFLDGLSIIDRGEVTARRKWTANDFLEASYRLGGWDVFASGSIADNNSLIKGSTINEFDYKGEPAVIGSCQNSSHPSSNYSIKTGFNYSKNDQSFGAYYRYNSERGNFLNDGSEWFNDSPEISRVIRNKIRANKHLLSLYYENKFNDRYLLHFDGDFRKSHSTTLTTTDYPEAQYEDVKSDEFKKSTLWAGKLYLTMPLWQGELSLGTQDSHTHTTLNHIMHNPSVEEYIPSSLTDVRQISLAAFASWSRFFNKLSINAGLRYEFVDYLLKLNNIKDKDISRKDNLLTPDISVGYSFSEESQMSVSYKMSTVKPPYSNLTSSLSYVGKHEIEGGNPGLKDEQMHDLQLFGLWKDWILQANYTRSIDTYGFVKRIYPAPSVQLIMQPINFDVSSLSLYLVWSKRIKAWSPNITAGMFKQWLRLGDTSYNRPIFSYYFDNVINLPKGFNVALNASGSTKGDMHTNRFGTTWFRMDASVSKTFLNDNLHLKLSATDIFNTSNNDWSMNTFGVFVNKRQKYDHRGISLSVTYRFQHRKSNYKGESASEEELNRL